MNSQILIKISFIIISFALVSFACNSGDKSENLEKKTYRSVGVVNGINVEKSENTAFKDKLLKDEIAAVVKFVREEIQSKANPKDKGKGHQH